MKKHFITAPPPPSGEVGRGLLLLLAFVCAMLLPACRKDPPDPPVPPPVMLPDTLPPLTTVGANTFGCYINGKLWLPKADWKAYFDPAFSPIQSFITSSFNGGYLKAESSIEGMAYLFNFGLSAKKGVYYADFDKVRNTDEFSVYYLDFPKNKWYYPDDRGRHLSNRLEIFYSDTLNNVMAGKFQFTLYKGNDHKITDRKDSIVITDGRFDIRYYH